MNKRARALFRVLLLGIFPLNTLRSKDKKTRRKSRAMPR